MTRARHSRPLTGGEITMAREVFGDAIDYGAVQVHLGRWWPLQPGNVVMAPDGAIWCPAGLWRADFAAAPFGLQRLFIHEMTHVWQAQRSGRWWLPLMRHPFCRYRYRPGKAFDRYGIEQQAEVVADAWVARRAGEGRLSTVLPFT